MNQEFFRRHRKLLIAELGKDSLVILTAYALLQKSGDMAAPFLQEAHFWWLTGIDEPGWILVIKGEKSWLLAPGVSEQQRIFEGGLTDVDAKRISGVDEVIESRNAKDFLEQIAHQTQQVFTLGKDPYQKYYSFVVNPAQVRLGRALKKQYASVSDCRAAIGRLRAIKSHEEVAAIQRAVNLTVEAFAQVGKNIKNYTHEYEIEADFTHFFRSRGATGHAYEPIVASGKNACTLHYAQNQAPLRRGGLVLIDIGSRTTGYAADITRTYALGKPTAREKAVHAAVEKAHFAIIDLIKPGVTLRDYQNQSDEIMKDALRRLGLLKKPEDYRRYFPHAISHGLGVDVHDSLGGYKEFQPGMVLTVEPGIYIPEEGIGVRIEDDILVTEDGYENLSASLPTSL